MDKLTTEIVLLSDLRTKGGTQQRAIDHGVVTRYAALLKDGVMLPALEAVRDSDGVLHLWDGFHRFEALKQIDCPSYEVHITDGDQRRAQWLSFSANRDHGFPRQPGTARKIIETILADTDWASTPITQIAKHVGVSRKHVHSVKADMEAHGVTRLQDAHGVTRLQDAHPTTSCGIDSKSPNSEAKTQADTQATADSTDKPAVARAGKVQVHRNGQSYEMKVAARTSASPDAEASIFDDVGHPVPADLVNAYLVHKGIVDRVLKDLRDLKQSVHSFYEGYETWERLSKSAFDSHHGNLRRVIEHINPYAVCPYCSGDGGIGSKCKGCQGVGWVNKVTYEGAPEDLK